MTDCKDCADRGQHIVATRLVRTTPVCDRHMAERLGIPYKPPASIALRLGLSPTPANKEKTAMPGNKPPEQFTIDAMRKDAASGMNLNKIAEKHAVGWITAKKYAGDAVVKTNGAKPAGGESSGQPRPNRMALADSMRFWWSCARNVIN